ncbi:uncharacterized protein M421DRAFT_291441 [Didymella exigua CBS 183.55]|uniref:Uncharacterized protein n=1 Tax=Didymella exigua CBS 183.55 TaxID=1150837 RepID=A0A6A5RZG6_9PLEO|nr:uncharacterized protein M421DRAFT_291441 [Didymella exigua CBS 183.55]KAF1932418.1 hypothetical protein M421DRAFT_291441 [Didymella exigua CBS 183.55]
MTAASFLTGVAGVIAAIGLALFLFGIPPELKRKMERAALKTMGENKLSYLAKGQIDKIPTSNQTDPLQLKKGVSNFAGGASQNPLGEAAGEAADSLTSPFTGR